MSSITYQLTLVLTVHTGMSLNTLHNYPSSGVTTMELSPPRVEFKHDIRLPVEIWLEVLEYLTPASIKSLTRTCQIFRWLAQPLLFKVFVVRLRGAVSTHGQFPHVYAHESNIRARLSLLEYPHIANAIEELRIVPTSSPSDNTQVPSMEELIDDVFAILPSLANLRKLVCTSIAFTPNRLSTLQHLHRLRDLELQSCYSATHPSEYPDLSSTPPLERVTFDYPYSSMDFFRNPQFLSVFLQSQKLRQIFAGPAQDILFAITAVKPLNLLTTLDIPVSCLASPVFIPALASCSAVQEISLHTSTGSHLPELDFDSLPSEILPCLRSYRGPRTYAPLFTGDREVTHLDITVSCQPEELSSTLHALGSGSVPIGGARDGSPALESLTCKVHHLDALLLKTIHTLFPSLKHLAISGAAVDIHSLSDVLDVATTPARAVSATPARRGPDLPTTRRSTSLPPRSTPLPPQSTSSSLPLQSIELTVQMGLPRLTKSWRTIASRMFLTRLVEAYPGLKTAKLTYQPEAAVIWERPAHMNLGGYTEQMGLGPVVDGTELRVEKQNDVMRKTSGLWDVRRLKL